MTRDIIEKHRTVIDYYVSEKDNGIYDALNKGILNAHGKYIMMLAAGDYLLDGALTTVRDIISDDIDVFCGTIIHHSDIGSIYSIRNGIRKAISLLFIKTSSEHIQKAAV